MATLFETITAPFKTISELTSQLVEVRDTVKFGEIQTKLQAQVMASYDAAMAMRERETALAEENATLKRRVAELETSNAKLDQYELKRLPPGVFVRALKPNGQPVKAPHYACEKCHGDGKISPLNSVLVFRGMETLRCSRCNSDVKTGHEIRSEPSRAITDYDIFNP